MLCVAVCAASLVPLLAERRQLVAQQDAEFAAGLIRDQARAQEAAEAQAEAARQDQDLRDRLAERERRRERAAAGLPEEPPAGPEVVTLHFRGANDFRIQRRFRVDEDARAVHRFVASLAHTEFSFSLFRYPRQVIPCQRVAHGITRDEVVLIELDEDHEVDGKSTSFGSPYEQT